MIKQDIKMKVNPKQSKRVQEICFENGVTWKKGEQNILNIDEKSLYVGEFFLSYGASTQFFNRHKFKEVDADLFIRTNGTCKEVKYKNAKEYLVAEKVYEQFLNGVKAQYEQSDDKEGYLKDIINANLFSDSNILRWSDSKEGRKFWEHHNKNLLELKLEKAITEIKEDIKTMFEEVLKLTPEQYAELHKMPGRNDAEVFAKYGFEVPEFECRLYDKIDSVIFGAVRHEHSGTWSLYKWDKNGNNDNISSYYDMYDLTPIKKPWHETCKYPAMIKHIKTGDMVLAESYKNGKIFYNDGIQYILTPRLQWVLVTNEEIEALKQ